jgi:hypothetical protein
LAADEAGDCEKQAANAHNRTHSLDACDQNGYDFERPNARRELFDYDPAALFIGA